MYLTSLSLLQTSKNLSDKLKTHVLKYKKEKKYMNILVDHNMTMNS